MFAYHFYRLIKRAQNIWFIYNTEPDAVNSGEASRFITQIEVEKVHEINKNILLAKTPVKYNTESSYHKTKAVQQKLKELIKNGVSASMLCLYVKDQIKFFESYILGLRDEKVEETIAASTIGNIVHDSLELLYKDYVGKKLRVESLKEMKKKINKTVENVIQNYVRKENIYRGKNVIIVKTVKKYVEKIIELDRKILIDKKEIKIKGIEKDF